MIKGFKKLLVLLLVVDTIVEISVSDWDPAPCPLPHHYSHVLELQTKVIRSFLKISQSGRRLIVGSTPIQHSVLIVS